MAKIIIIGAGGVGTVVAHKCAQHPEVFSEIVIASRTLKNVRQSSTASASPISAPTPLMPTALSSSLSSSTVTNRNW